jgi:hypothetical protein
MKLWSVLAGSLLLAGCQGGPVPLPVIIKPTPEPEKVVELPRKAPEPVKPALAISDDVASLTAWSEFRGELLKMTVKQRDNLSKNLQYGPVVSLQQLLIRIHPDNPYPVRFKAQTQLGEQLSLLPAGLAAMLRWDHAYNQKLLESESAVKALSRLNGQQQDNLERLQKQNADLQKKIDALTQIEAKLNQSGGG